MARRKSYIMICAGLAGALLLSVSANWFFSPFLRSEATDRQRFMEVAFDWYRTRPRTKGEMPARDVLYVGLCREDGLYDFPEADMDSWAARNQNVLPVSRLVPSDLGGFRDAEAKQPDVTAMLLEGQTWRGRNTMECDLLMSEGFCVLPIRLTIRHGLWGWYLVEAENRF